MGVLTAFLGLLLALLLTVPSTSVARNPNCYKLSDYGRCKEDQVMWAYSSYDHRCFTFLYSSCGGNGNRFATQNECERACGLRK